MKIDFCFFHIEKCAGSSLRIMLYEYFKNIFDIQTIYIPEKYNVKQNLMNETDLNFFKDKNYKILLCHCNFDQINVTDSFSKDCFSITCVREPLYRFLSHYYFFKNNEKIKFAQLTDEQIIPMLKDANLLTKRLSGNKNNLDIALQNVKCFNCVIIYEQLETDVALMNELLNKKTNANLKIDIIYKNVHNLYSNEDYQRLKQFEKYFEKDIELYNTILNMNAKDRFRLEHS